MAAPLSVLFSNGLITDAFIDVCINDGTHASLHALMLLGTGAVGLDVLNLLKRGPPGPAGGLWSVPRSQNAKRVYATHHFADYQACRAHLPRPTAILPNATANIIPWLINNCSDCFKFLVRQGVIKSYGYDNALRSYFHIACSAPMNKPLVQYMLKRLPDDELFAPQTLTLNMVPADWTRASIFWYLRNDEALFAQYITRLDWLTRRTISRASVAVLRNGGNMMQVLGHPFGHAYLAKYLNPNIAGLLADQIDPAWSINLGEFIINDENNDSASLWIAVIKEKNPRRIQMLKWMAENPFTPTPAFPNGTMVNEPNYSPRVSKGWHWKATPLAAAVAFGDAVAVRELCRMPAVDLLAGCPGLNPAIMALPGAAGLMNELKEQNLPAFEMWLQYAAPLIRATAFIFPGVTRMLDHIVSKTVYERNVCTRRMRATTNREIKRRLSRERDTFERVCLSAIKIILDAFRTIQGPLDNHMSRELFDSAETLFIAELYDEPLYKAWSSGFITAGRNAVAGGAAEWNVPRIYDALQRTSRPTLRRDSFSA